MSVYLVQELIDNLISVSQLCDEGLTLIFTSVKSKCKKSHLKRGDKYGETVLKGVKLGNNCYMWEQEAVKWFSANDDLNL